MPHRTFSTPLAFGSLCSLALALLGSAPVQAQATALSPVDSVRYANPFPQAQDQHFSRGMATGDFDGDGIADIAVAEVGGERVRIYLGQAWTVGTEGPVIRFTTMTVDTPFIGYHMVAGDFDNDGRDELAIGSPGTADNNIVGAGAVHVMDRASNGAWSVQETIRLGQFGYGGTPGTGDSLGAALAVGRFDGGPHADLAIGIRGKTVAGEPNAGRVMIVYGTPAGLTATGHTFFDRAAGPIAGTPEEDDFFGWSLASGDFDTDDYDDLAVGVRSAHCNPDGTGPRGGGVVVLRGAQSGVTAAFSQWFAPGQDGMPGECASSGPNGVYGFGYALSAGQLTALDYRPDLLIGAPRSPGGGAVVALFGREGNMVAAEARLLRAAEMPEPVAEPARFGQHVVIDYLRHGVLPPAAAFIGAPLDTVNGVADAGSVWVVRASSFGPNAVRAQRWTANSGLAIGPAQVNDQFGSAFVTGDFNDDSTVDLAIGSYLDDEAGEDAGAFQVIFASGFIFRDGFQ